MALHGRARFPGIEKVVSWEYTDSYSVQPGVALITACPQAGFPAKAGSLMLADGRRTIRLDGCKVSQVKALRIGAGLTVWQITIFDRRWRWAGGQISGHYNIRQSDGTIEPSTERTPQQLAALCFIAMGERSADVGQLPDDSRPEITWDAVPPADALEELVERLGCRVSLRIDNQRAQIVRLGQGAQLGRSEVLDLQTTVQAPERPDDLIFLGGPALFQTMFALEPVGLDTDGLIKPIAELSYRPRRFNVGVLAGIEILPEPPETGWENIVPPAFPDLGSDEANQLARLSVFRWYRIRMVDPKSVSVINGPDTRSVIITSYGTGKPSVPGDWSRQNVRGSFKVSGLEEILPIEDRQILKQPRQRPAGGNGVVEEDDGARVYGYFIKPTLDGNEQVQQDGAEWTLPFKVMKEQGIVDFSPNYVQMRGRWRDTIKLRPAIMYLQVAHRVRDPQTREERRYAKVLSLPGQRLGTLPGIIRREEAVLMLTLFDDQPLGPLSVRQQPSIIFSNQEELDAESNYYLAAEAARYEVRTPQEVTYMGLHPIPLDGAIRQVTYRGNPVVTTASRHTEHSLIIEPYWARRQRMISGRVTSPEFQANIRQQLEDMRRAAGRALGPGLRG